MEDLGLIDDDTLINLWSDHGNQMTFFRIFVSEQFTTELNLPMLYSSFP